MTDTPNQDERRMATDEPAEGPVDPGTPEPQKPHPQAPAEGPDQEEYTED